MALIKCNECLGQISDKAQVCPHCGNPMIQQELNKEKIEQINYQNQEELNNENQQETTEENQLEINDKNNNDIQDNENNHKKITIIMLLIIVAFLIVIELNNIKEKQYNNKIIEENLKIQEEIEKKCKEYTDRLQTFVDNKDYQGFKDNWYIHEDLIGGECETIYCSCPKAIDLHTKIDLFEAEEYYQKGNISKSYNVLDMSIGNENEIKEFYDTHQLLKLLPTKEKEEITGINSTFGEWGINVKEGGDIDFNKQYVNITSTYLYMNFSTYSDTVSISGHLANKKHPYWNDEKNCCAVERFDYRIIDNKIELKRENEKEYDAMFEIISLTDTELKLKLLISTTDVNKGHIYVMQYKWW